MNDHADTLRYLRRDSGPNGPYAAALDAAIAALEAGRSGEAGDGKPLDLETHEREALNYLGSALTDRNHKRAVDKALALCDFYAGRDQLTLAHKALLNRDLLPAAAPAVAKAWLGLVERIAKSVNCRASDSVDGNEHVVRAVERLAESAVEWYGPAESGRYFIRRGDDWFDARPATMLSPEDFVKLGAAPQQPPPVGEGPDSPDGYDHEGFPGGDARMEPGLLRRVLEDNHAFGHTTPETLNAIEAALSHQQPAPSVHMVNAPQIVRPVAPHAAAAPSVQWRMGSPVEGGQPAPVSEPAASNLLIPGEISSKLGDAASGEGYDRELIARMLEDSIRRGASFYRDESLQEQADLLRAADNSHEARTVSRRLTATGQGAE